MEKTRQIYKLSVKELGKTHCVFSDLSHLLEEIENLLRENTEDSLTIQVVSQEMLEEEFQKLEEFQGW